MAALSLSECTEDDMPRYFDIVADAFGSEHEYINIVFPGHTTAAGRTTGAARFLATKRADPLSTFLKVTDQETGEIIGVAKWIIYGGEIPEEGGLGTDEYWRTGQVGEHGEEGGAGLAEYADALYREYLVDRRGAVKETNGQLISLDMLCVDPKHHFRGAGRMLVEWGTQKADELGVQTVVEGSVYGRHLYEQCGFVMKKHTVLKQPKGWEHRPKQRYFWMVRPAKNSGST